MKQVLIVDDSGPIRERIAAMLLETDRIKIVGLAGTGDEAVAKVKRMRPDTVILDIHLPGKSGIQVLKEIKLLDPEISVIMLTNFDNKQYQKQCRQLGADHFLNKTLEFDQIADIVLGYSAR